MVNKLLKLDPFLIGNRIKSTRMLSGYSRKAFAMESKISAATLRVWEEPTEGRYGLSEKGAERLVSAFNQCGVYCTKEWLLYGHGPGSKIMNMPISNVFEDQNIHIWDEEVSILKDIESFKINNPNPTIATITDNAMFPFFGYGDYVAGNKRQGNDILELIGLNCILELRDRTVVRRITIANSKNRYTLTSLNQEKDVIDSVILDVEVKSAAEIIWHRWRKKA